MVIVDIPSQFGYVIAVVIATAILNIWLSVNVGKARKKFDVKYPTMYSDTNQVFNCYQRAHQNFLEGVTFFLITLIIAGIRYPVSAAIAGVIYLFGRIVYSLGYYTGDPSKRQQGAFGYIAVFYLLGASIVFALELLKFI